MGERAGRVEGKVAIVTGAGSTPGPGVGTGKATAVVLAREGARVLMVDLYAERAKDTNWRVRPSAFSSPGGNSSSIENSVMNSSSRKRSRWLIARSRPCVSPRRGAGIGRMAAT